MHSMTKSLHVVINMEIIFILLLAKWCKYFTPKSMNIPFFFLRLIKYVWCLVLKMHSIKICILLPSFQPEKFK